MSKTSSSLLHNEIEELRAEMGGTFSGIARDQLADETVKALMALRGLIVEAAQHDQVSHREMAKRLGVSANNVARQINADADMYVGSAVALAHALGRRWRFTLEPNAHSEHPSRNFRVIDQPVTEPPIVDVASGVWDSTTTLLHRQEPAVLQTTVGVE
jgi:hypothetical protein